MHNLTFSFTAPCWSFHGPRDHHGELHKQLMYATASIYLPVPGKSSSAAAQHPEERPPAACITSSAAAAQTQKNIPAFFHKPDLTSLANYWEPSFEHEASSSQALGRLLGSTKIRGGKGAARTLMKILQLEPSKLLTALAAADLERRLSLTPAVSGGYHGSLLHHACAWEIACASHRSGDQATFLFVEGTLLAETLHQPIPSHKLALAQVKAWS